MNLQKFTLKAQEAIQKGMEIAASENHQGIEPPHILKAFLQDPESIVMSILQRLEVDTAVLAQEVDAALAKLPVVTGASVTGQYAGDGLKKVFDGLSVVAGVAGE